MYNYINYPCNNMSVEQYFNAYTELSETQFKFLIEQIKNGSNYDDACVNSYQIVDY